MSNSPAQRPEIIEDSLIRNVETATFNKASFEFNKKVTKAGSADNYL